MCQDNTDHKYYQPLIYLSSENGYKKRSKWFATESITDADYTDEIALLANAPAQAEYLLHSVDQVARSIGLSVNSDKTAQAF